MVQSRLINMDFVQEIRPIDDGNRSALYMWEHNEFAPNGRALTPLFVEHPYDKVRALVRR